MFALLIVFNFLQGKGQNARISVEFTITNGNTLIACGYRHKDTLTRSVFYIQYNVPIFSNEEERKAFISGGAADAEPTKWNHTTPLGDDTECVKLSNISKGHHVLTIATGEVDGEFHPSALTHIITF